LRYLLNEDAADLIEEVETPEANAYYAQVWALMAFLLHERGERYAAVLPTIARDLRDSTLQINALTARAAAPSPAETSYGEAVFRRYVTDDLEPFESEFDAYVRDICWKR
jgi:hypothetical protein